MASQLHLDDALNYLIGVLAAMPEPKPGQHINHNDRPQKLTPIRSTGQLMDAVGQRAAEHHVDLLDAAANPEHRHALGYAGAHQGQDERVAARIDGLIGRKRGAS